MHFSEPARRQKKESEIRRVSLILTVQGNYSPPKKV